MKILVLDNYDSFTYNLVHILAELGYREDMDIIRNDKIDIQEVEKYDKILLSPGPGIPDEAGILKEIIKVYGPTKSIMGVCLGHQGIGEVYGSKLVNLDEVLHGVVSNITIVDPGERLFENLPVMFSVCHYHSWVIDSKNIGEALQITAVDPRGLIMGVRHKTFDVRGVQFHPESILTEHGKEIIKNWLGN